jgi:hypothetical protein
LILRVRLRELPRDGQRLGLGLDGHQVGDVPGGLRVSGGRGLGLVADGDDQSDGQPDEHQRGGDRYEEARQGHAFLPFVLRTSTV